MATCLNPYCSGRWSRTLISSIVKTHLLTVLILIVVEDGLVQPPKLYSNGDYNVLILIVVEDGLVHCEVCELNPNWKNVLILIVVEDGLVLAI